MTTLKIEAEAVRDLPPSAKLVYLVLQEDGPLTQADLCEQTLLHPRTVRSALTDLRDVGIVEKRPYAGGDARQSLYTACSPENNR